jgi:hypothetical protein
LNIIGHGNPDNNLESSCRLREFEKRVLRRIFGLKGKEGGGV